jgi:hypothetical protein
MKSFSSVAFLILVCAATASSAADKYDGWDFYSGEELYRTCKSKDAADQQTCSAYVCGVMDAWTTQYILGEKKTYPICLPMLPGALTCGQMGETVLTYLDDHPDIRKSGAAGAVSYALMIAYPCKN